MRTLLFALVAMALPQSWLAAQTANDPDDVAGLVARLAKVGSAYAPSFSPDGREIAFISDLTGLPQAWRVPFAGGWPHLVTSLDDQVVGLAWSPTEDLLALAVAPGGGMNVQIHLAHPDGTGHRVVTDGGRETNNLGGWTSDGRYLFIGSNRLDPSSSDAYLFDLSDEELRYVAATGGVGGLTDLSADGARGVLMRLRNRGDNDLYLLDLTSDTEVLLTAHEGLAEFGSAVFSVDGQTVYFTSNMDRDLKAFARVRLDAAGQPGPVEVITERQDAELQTFGLSPDGTTAALLWNNAGRSELAFLDLETGTVRTARPLPGDIAEGVGFSPDGRSLALTVSGSNLPRDVWLYSLAGNRYRQLTFSPHAGVDLSPLIRPELVRYPAHDGLELSAWLYRASDRTGPGPVVLSFHGGPEGQERPQFNPTYQALLAQGISVLAPNVRGSSGFGKRYVNLDNGPLRVNGVRDIEATLDYLTQAGIADPERIGIMGGSYGGYMVMAGLAEYPDRFAAGANLFGVVNFETFFANTEPWMAAISTVEY